MFSGFFPWGFGMDNEGPSLPPSADPDGGLRVVVVEDDAFSRTAVIDALEAQGFQVRGAVSVNDALVTIGEFDPHAVCTDLHLGAGPSGLALLNRLSEEQPWVGRVILTSHQSVELATGQRSQPPAGTIALFKSSLDSLASIGEAIRESMNAAEVLAPISGPTSDGQYVVSRGQAEILKRIAEGYTNSAIARERGSSVRSVEMMVSRIFRALGIESNDDFNPRVLASRMWQAGDVTVR